MCSKDLPDQIPENVADKIIKDAKASIFNKHIRKSSNGLDYEVSVSHSNRSLVLKVKNGSIVTCCSHSLATAQYINKVKDLVDHACKKAELINLSSLAGFGRPPRSKKKKGFQRKCSKIPSSVTGSNTSISLKTQRDTTLWEETKIKQKISNQLNKNTSYSLIGKNNQQLSDIAKFLNAKKQTLVSAGKCLGLKPPQPELQQQQHQLLKRHGKISLCNSCQCEFDKGDSTLHILGSSKNDWFIHVDRKENIKLFKLSQQSRCNCGKNSAFSIDVKKCIPRR